MDPDPAKRFRFKSIEKIEHSYSHKKKKKRNSNKYHRSFIQIKKDECEGLEG